MTTASDSQSQGFSRAADAELKIILSIRLTSCDNLPKNSIVRFFESPTGTSRCERLGTAARDYSRLIQYHSVFSRVILLVRETDSKKKQLLSFLLLLLFYVIQGFGMEARFSK